MILLFVFTVAHHGTKIFPDRLGVLNSSVVKDYQDLQIYRIALCRILNVLDEDHELEEFVAGIPGFGQSAALRNLSSQSPDHAGGAVLTALPDPIIFHEQLPWSIILPSHRATTGDLSEIIRRRRTRAHLLTRRPITFSEQTRDVLASYAAGA